MKRLKDYGLSLVLAALFLTCWVWQWVAGFAVYAEQAAHTGDHATWVGYLPHFGQATAENWTSEMLQLASFVVLSAYLLHKGSPQSKDGSDRQERKLDDLTRKVDWLLREAEARAEREREREAEARRERR